MLVKNLNCKFNFSFASPPPNYAEAHQLLPVIVKSRTVNEWWNKFPFSIKRVTYWKLANGLEIRTGPEAKGDLETQS